jgi:hypothetical protein
MISFNQAYFVDDMEILWVTREPRIEEGEQTDTRGEALSNLYLTKLGKSWVCSLLSMCACILRGV